MSFANPPHLAIVVGSGDYTTEPTMNPFEVSQMNILLSIAFPHEKSNLSS